MLAGQHEVVQWLLLQDAPRDEYEFDEEADCG